MARTFWIDQDPKTTDNKVHSTEPATPQPKGWTRTELSVDDEHLKVFMQTFELGYYVFFRVAVNNGYRDEKAVQLGRVIEHLHKEEVHA